MKRFIQGEHRGQSTLLPESLDDYVSDTNPVRVVDVFVDELDLANLGFDGVIPAETGRPAYHPAILLKIYIYGYLNRIQSSRRLEREAQRNVELMWLTGRLMPDFKTIANFRKDNSKAIRGVCRQFVLLCQQLGLFDENLVAIDGSKFKAVNNRDRNFTSAKLKRRMEEIEASIGRYLAALDAADRQIPSASAPDIASLEDKIAKLKSQMKELQGIETQLNDSPDKQVSLTDSDARSMMTRGSGIVGYNVQTAVDTQHHLIVAHEVTNRGSDRDQLSSMAKQAREAIGAETLSVVADRGYFKGEEILACHDANITAYVPKPMTSSAKADGRFNKDAFVYDATKNEYTCPAGEALIWRFSSVEKGMNMHCYWSSKCQSCALKTQCTPSTNRRVRRWEHEAVLEEMQHRLNQAPEMMRVRKRTVEHPFGTLKQWMGATHFLTRKLNGVSAEMSLNVLAYNLKRVMKIIGTEGLLKAMAA
ncbi:IS1182 family transposase ISPmo1 [Stutzerimonas decontaminans]|uniref:ISPmo1 transposase n=11 Tax=Pseudomonadaceae TaxID=135621 RepID=A0A1W6QXW1_PSEPU|nr:MULTISPECIES: IS1182-like element ISPmo1 family transposase [Pseudomonadaceae]ARO46326.1 ISPmo1 transposase [Pseudomonas putida]MCQ4246603.1 IS1182-like element ISPmo1 family transposase [Stutzerimonas decontaminans]MCZ7706395.1 IS1182-like element ISPmo1 family transposase [Pseudomonas aeruginosa]MCZ7713010.1 IS1182-like element ISPmo1 family transposase [Pseudomonas aeruginosa]MCZ7767347.1 IS1182-like element ISPmo1 family transposase [Pseudomonas aeruginosa]